MYFHFLIEDISSTALIEILMNGLKEENDELDYVCTSFKGIGTLPSHIGLKNKDVKTKKLLNDLPKYLKGLNNSYQYMNAVIVIVLDNDKRTTEDFRQELELMAKACDISIDYVFCIAVEEVEAWLLGDKEALLTAYPDANKNALRNYKQDSICGTWERLADVVFPGGYEKMKRCKLSWVEIGEHKTNWAKNIGRYMQPEKNNSPSFQYFWQQIQCRLQTD